jgi:hypothetical protein
VAGGVAVPAVPHPHPHAADPTGTGLAQPPSMTYDPALEAQRRAAQRGLEDTEADVKTKQHFADRDLSLALRGIRINTTRHRQDTNREYGRGVQKLANQETDTRKDAGRQEEDFHTRLADIGRQFAELGKRQGEGANAAGVNDAGTAAASAAARGANQVRAEAPIHTAEGRLQEDLMSTLDRIAQARGYLGEDHTRVLNRLNQDRNIQRREAHRETGRTEFSLERELERAKREGAIAQADILEQEIYQARQNHPGAFNKQGEHNGQTGGGGPKPQPKPAVGGAKPVPKKKGRR